VTLLLTSPQNQREKQAGKQANPIKLGVKLRQAEGHFFLDDSHCVLDFAVQLLRALGLK
jgi:hypothetical protein